MGFHSQRTPRYSFQKLNPILNEESAKFHGKKLKLKLKELIPKT